MQNISRGSHKIRIRWLSQAAKEEPKGKRRGKITEPVEPVYNFVFVLRYIEQLPSILCLVCRPRTKLGLISIRLTSTTTPISSAF